MGPIGSETPVNDYQSAMRNIEEEFFLSRLTFEDGTREIVPKRL